MRELSEVALRRLREQAPLWPAAVAKVKDDNLDYVVMTLCAFAGEPELLYDALIYATTQGVNVMVLPGNLEAPRAGKRSTNGQR